MCADDSMKIAITGPTGGIGVEFIRQAIELNDEVIAIVNPKSARISNLPKSENLEIVPCLMSDYESIMGKRDCDMFVHMAWKGAFGSNRDDTYIQCDNIKHSLDAVRLAESWGAKSFVGTGSQAEYGLTNEALTGNLPVNPLSGYGIAKYSAGKLCGILCSQFEIKYNWARIVSVFGKYDRSQTLISYLIDSLTKDIVPELTACEQVWDYIYAKDAAHAIRLIGDKGIDGKTYCVGSGHSRVLKDYVTSLRDIVNPKSELKFGIKDYYPHQPMHLAVDISELNVDTGFRPGYSFEDGIREMMHMGV